MIRGATPPKTWLGGLKRRLSRRQGRQKQAELEDLIDYLSVRSRPALRTAGFLPVRVAVVKVSFRLCVSVAEQIKPDMVGSGGKNDEKDRGYYQAV
jgi:hypothetical protein